METPYKADFLCYREVIVETKALRQLTSIERAQIIHYLKATGLRRGILINFGAQRLEYERFVYGKEGQVTGEEGTIDAADG